MSVSHGHGRSPGAGLGGPATDSSSLGYGAFTGVPSPAHSLSSLGPAHATVQSPQLAGGGSRLAGLPGSAVGGGPMGSGSLGPPTLQAGLSSGVGSAGGSNMPQGPLSHAQARGLVPHHAIAPPLREDHHAPLIEESSTAKKQHSLLGRFFLRQYSEAFADRAELACRAAVCVVAMAAPLVLPPDALPEKFALWQAKGYYTKNTPLMFLYILDLTLGQTMANALSGLFGSSVAFGVSKLLLFAIPGGVMMDTAWYLVGAVCILAALLVWGVLWLNFGMTGRIFFLFTFAFHFMDFLNPSMTDCYVGETCGPRYGELASAGIAALLAVLCTVFPTPFVASRKARASAREGVASLSRAWMDLASHFCGNHQPDYRQERLVADLRKAQQMLEQLDSYLVHAYYEFSCLRSVRNVRDFLTRVRRTLGESTDRLLCVWNTCMQEAYGQAHLESITRLWPDVHRVLAESNRLLLHSTDIACGGRVLPSDEVPLRDTVTRVREAVSSLSNHWRELQASQGLRGIAEELLDEHHFVVQVCAIGRIAAELAEDLPGPGGRSLPPAETPPGLMDKVALGGKHLVFATRSFIIFAVAFVAGVFGHSKAVVQYDARTAALAALMLRKAIGCSGARNSDRLQAVAVGSLVGTFTFASVGWCSWWAYVAVGTILGGWVLTSMFNHFDPEQYTNGLSFDTGAAGATAGLLSAYFGAEAMMEQCTDAVFSVTDVFGHSFYMFLNSLAAVFIVTAVDWALAPESAARLATRSYGEAMRVMIELAADLMDPHVLDERRSHSREISQRLQIAEFLGKQSETEVRYWRNPWRSLIYGDAMQSAQRLRMSICGLEYCSMEGGRPGGGKSDRLRRITGLPSFTPMRRVAIEKLDHVDVLVDSALSQETGDVMQCLGNPQLKRNFDGEFVHYMRAFITEVNKSPEVLQSEPGGNTLEFDADSQAVVLLSCALALVSEAAALQGGVLMRAY